MKNTLLVAIMIPLSTALFGHNDQKQADLLVHLKNVRSELISILDDNHTSRMKELPEQRLREYTFFRDVVDGFYAQAPTLQKIITEELVRPEFDIVCDNIGLPFTQIQNKFDFLPTHQRMSTLIPVEGGMQAQDPIEINQQIKEELFELFVPIFESAHTEFCTTGEPLEEGMTQEGIKGLFNEFMDLIIWHPEMLMYNWPMIILLNEKIAELEAQAE